MYLNTVCTKYRGIKGMIVWGVGELKKIFLPLNMFSRMNPTFLFYNAHFHQRLIFGPQFNYLPHISLFEMFKFYLSNFGFYILNLYLQCLLNRGK